MYLGIDLGTGTLKAAVFAEDGSLVDAAEEAYDAPNSAAAAADFDPAVWWQVCRRVVRQVTAERGTEIESVAVAGQMHGVVLVDGKGRPVRDAVLWPDSRAVETLEAFVEFDSNHIGVLANPLVPGMAGPILTWMSRHDPRPLTEAVTAVQPKDWLRMQLCGFSAVTDPSDASATLLYDVRADGWSADLCEALGLDVGLLPSVRPSTSIVGSLTPSVADDLGLESIPVAVGCADAAAALLGAGIENPGTALVNIGSGGQVITPMTEPAPGRHVGPGFHQYRSASESTHWYAMAAVANAGLALGWVRNLVGWEWDQVYDLADSVLETTSQDPLFLPFLVSEREPSRDHPRGAAWSGLTLADDRDTLIRSALRGVSFYLGLRARALMDATGATTVAMSGGSTRHVGWVDLLATVLGRGVTVSDDMHLTVRGAARVAARAIGRDLPDPAPGFEVAGRSDVDVEAFLSAFDEEVTRYFN